MNKLVYTVFKTIAMSVIFIFLFDIVFYMYRITSLNARIESFSTSMKKVVMENNYLPSEIADTYSEIFKNMICDYNQIPYRPGMSDTELANGTAATGQGTVNTAAFIAGMRWNYNTDATGINLGINANRMVWNGSGWAHQNVDIVKKKMSDPADYGDVMVVQLKVDVFQPLWGWQAGVAGGLYNGEDVTQWTRNAVTTTLNYTYYVPCLNFRTITSN